MLVCDNCGTVNPDDSNFCKRCRERIGGGSGPKRAEPKERRGRQLRCKMCNDELTAQSTFCVSCGDPMCLSCAVTHHQSMEYYYEANYYVAKREINIKINFPRCLDCIDQDEHYTAILKEKLRHHHSFRYRFMDVRDKKYASLDPEIDHLQNILEQYAFPKILSDAIGCPSCGHTYNAHEYYKLIKQVERGEIYPTSIMTGPFGEEGRPIPDYFMCNRCGYEGIFISGWGLRRFLSKYGDESLKGTMWYDIGLVFKNQPTETF